jgi:hypothetical protein
MGFQYVVPAVVGGTVLIIERIESQNYITTVSGWAINADGTAEFSAVIVRGTLIAGQVVINGDDYPNAIALYTLNPSEDTPAVIRPGGPAGNIGRLSLEGPNLFGGVGGVASITLEGQDDGTNKIEYSATDHEMIATTSIKLESGSIIRLSSNFVDYIDIVNGNEVTGADLRDSSNDFPMQSGTVLSAAVTTFQTIAVAFPTPFSSVPRVVANPVTSVDVAMQAYTSGATVNGFNLHFKRATAVATNINWIATNV